MRRLTPVLAVAIASGVMAGPAAPARASAAANYGCPYPYVCFYLRDVGYDWTEDKIPTPVAKYRDITSYYQTLPTKGQKSTNIYNTRNDDVVYVKYSDNTVGCIENDTYTSLTRGKKVTGVKISSDSNCWECHPGSPC